MENSKKYCKTLDEKRAQILRILTQTEPGSRFNNCIFKKDKRCLEKVLSQMLELYDKYVWDGRITRALEEKSRKIVFDFESISPFMTAYSYLQGNRNYILTFDPRTFPLLNFENRTYFVGHKRCNSEIECVQLLFEHEMAHVIKDLFDGPMEKDIHGSVFSCLLREVFCQTSVSHNLLDGIVIAKPRRDQIRPRDFVDLNLDFEGVQFGTVLRTGREYVDVFTVKNDLIQVPYDQVKGVISYERYSK